VGEVLPRSSQTTKWLPLPWLLLAATSRQLQLWPLYTTITLQGRPLPQCTPAAALQHQALQVHQAALQER
jgi:hypothetical protein